MSDSLLRLVDGKLSESLFDRIDNVVFFVKDRRGRYALFNDTLRVRSRLAHKSELLGRTAEEVFGPSLGANFTQQDNAVIKTGAEIRDKLERHLYPNGVEGWCLTWKAPLRSADGAVQGLVGLSRDLHSPDARHPEYRRLSDAVEHLSETFAQPLRMSALARKCGLSLAQFERLVQRVYQVSPRQLLARTRIEAAADLLRRGELSVAAVAHACGYADHSAFTRQFRAMTGFTPRKYRVAHGAISS